MVADLVVWHEATRISHGDALTKAQSLRGMQPHPAVAAFRDELVAQLPDVQVRWDKKSYARLTVRSGVPRVRYLAAKHRLVCFDLAQEAVLNPPLLRRPDALELTTEVGIPIEDPTPAHILRAAHSLSAENWFMALEGDDDHFVQCGYGKRAGVDDGCYMLETRGEKHLQVEITDVLDIIDAFQAEIAGDPTWRDRFHWRPVTLS